MAPLRLTPVIIAVNRDKFSTKVYKMKANQYVLAKNYLIALGQEGHTTPAGMYFVNGKNTKPDWLAPDAEWVPFEMRGQIYPIESEHNPFAGGFISIANTEGVGFHGTKFDPQLGTRASHGCIRMSVDDLLDLYKRAPIGAPVFIY